MKRIALILALLLVAAAHTGAQNNPYEIDDRCYGYFVRMELLIGKPEFQQVNDSLLIVARECGDTKAETLHFVQKLKNLSKLGRTPGSGVTDEQVEQAAQELRDVADELGYSQYYFYAYNVMATYYYNRGFILKSTAEANRMQQVALDRGDAYGHWLSHRFMVSLYLNMYDFDNVRKYALATIDMYNTSEDPTLRKQSVSRVYFDLADAYPVNSDSMRMFVNKGAETAIMHMDTLKSYYYLAVLAALDRNYPQYRKYRDYCVKDPQLKTIGLSVPATIEAMDAVIKGAPPDTLLEIASRIETFRGKKFIANVAEAYEYYKTAFVLEQGIVEKLADKISSVNHDRINELHSTMEYRNLSMDLKTSSERAKRMALWVAILMGTVFAIVAAFLLVELIATRKRRDRDEKMIADLREANEKVRLADEAKTRFVQNMSHEVRTPLNAIVGFSQLLSLPDGSFTEAEKDEFAGHIVNNTQMLTMLLDDILNASAMDSGKYRIVIEDAEMHFMAQQAISSSEHRLQPGVTLTYRPCLEEPFHFRADSRRVQQVLINLLTNACKHTSQGSIVLSSSLDEHPGMVTYAVTDTGTGVPPEMEEVIFERFRKLDSFVQGTGLGLSICRDIATRMGAKVYLDTTYTGGGARFVFEVPVTPAKTPA